jgi:hypothetical protein
MTADGILGSYVKKLSGQGTSRVVSLSVNDVLPKGGDEWG